METKNWIAIGAVSALSVGVMAAGAVTTANAMPLMAEAGIAPGLAVAEDTKGNSADLEFSVTSDSIVSPELVAPASPLTPEPTSSESPVSPASVAPPASVASPASPVSVASPASVDSAD